MSCGARVGWRRRGSGHHPVLEVRDAGGLDGTDLLKLHLRGPEVVEEASTVAEQYWYDVELKLVQQSRCQVLVSDLGAAPPARPLLVAPGAAADRAKHVPAHHPSADVLARFLEYPCALVDFAAPVAVGLAPGGQRNHPVVEPLAALAERVLLALVRAGDETVQRDRDMTPKLAHRASSVAGRCGRGDLMNREQLPTPAP